MSTRRRLPPGAKWVTLPSGARRVEIVTDAGMNPATGKRRQVRRRFESEADATKAYARMSADVSAEYPSAVSGRHPRVCLGRIGLALEPSPDLTTFARGRIHPSIENDLDPFRPGGQGD